MGPILPRRPSFEQTHKLPGLLALCNSWDLAMHCGWSGGGAAVVATPLPWSPCQATFRVYSHIDKNVLSGQYADISAPFPPLCPKGSLPWSLSWMLLWTWSVRTLGQNVRMSSSSAQFIQGPDSCHGCGLYSGPVGVCRDGWSVWMAYALGGW